MAEPVYEYVLGDRMGAAISTVENPMDRRLVYDLNRPASVTARAASNDDTIRGIHSDGVPFLNVGDRTLKVFRDGKIVCAGIVWMLADEGDENASYTSFTAFDPWQFLWKRIARRNDGKIRKTTHVANNAAAAVKRHIDKTIFYAGPCYIETSGTFATGTTYFSQDYDQDYLARVLIDICDTGACDVIMEPVDRSDGILAVAHAPALRGTDKSASVVFEYHSGAHLARTWNRELNMETAANDLFNFSESKTKFTEGWDQASAGRYGVMEDAQVLSGVKHQDLLDELTAQELLLRKDPREIVAFQPVASDQTPRVFDDFFLGDLVDVVCSDDAREAVTGVQRVYGVTVEPDNDGVERITELRVSRNQG